MTTKKRTATKPKTTEIPEAPITAESLAEQLAGGDPDTTAGLLAALEDGKGEEDEATEDANPAYGRTAYSTGLKHLLQPSGGTGFRTLCNSEIKEVFRPGGVSTKMRLCTRCAKISEATTPVKESEVDYSADPFRLKEYTPTPEATPTPKATPRKAAKPEPADAQQPEEEEAQPEGDAEQPEEEAPEQGTEAKAVPTPGIVIEKRPNQPTEVLKKLAKTTAAEVLKWINEQDEASINNRTKNRWRRNLERHGIALKNLTPEDEKNNQGKTLAYQIAKLDAPEAMEANLDRMSKIWPKLDKGTLKGYERNLYRAWDAFCEAHK